jgi:hypothetical protein
MSETLRPETNVPVELALQFSDGLPVEGRFGDQVMFTLVDGRKLYVPPIVAKKIEALGVQRGEVFELCKTEVKNGNRKSIEWQVNWPSSLERALEESVESANGEGAGKNPRKAHPALAPVTPIAQSNGTARHANTAAAVPTKQQYGAAFTQFLIDAAAAVQQAEVECAKQGGSVRFDNRDVAAIATSMFIAADKGGFLTWRPR